MNVESDKRTYMKKIIFVMMMLAGVASGAKASDRGKASTREVISLVRNYDHHEGFEIVSVAISNLDYDPESKELINLRNRAAMLKDPSIRESYVQANVSEGLKAAGSNSAGAGQAYFAMGMGMQSTGVNTFSQTNAQQMAAMQMNNNTANAAGGWKCACGAENTGKFCSECGAQKPSANWKCACGAENEGKFCAECGAKRP